MAAVESAGKPNFFDQCELEQIEKCAEGLRAVPMKKAGRGYVSKGRINVGNNEDFRRVQSVTPFQASGIQLEANGTAVITAVINLPELMSGLKERSVVAKAFNFNARKVKEELLKRGGKEEGKDCVRIPLPNTEGKDGVHLPMVPPTHGACAPPAMAAAPPAMTAPKMVAPGLRALKTVKVEVPTGSSSNVDVSASLADTISKGFASIDWKSVACSCGIAALSGFVMGVLDEILVTLIKNPKILWWTRAVVNGVAFAIGAGILVATLISAPVSLPTLLATILLGLISNVCGVILGKLFFRGMKRLYKYVSGKLGKPEPEIPEPDPAPAGMPVELPQPAVIPLPVHVCQTGGGWFRMGKCIGCEDNAARFGFVHKNNNFAHVAFCSTCVAKYVAKYPGLCPCRTIASSAFELDYDCCENKTCVEVGFCLPCKDDGNGQDIKTATCWREDSANNVEVMYCEEHMKKKLEQNLPNLRFGKCIAGGVD